MRSSQGVRKIKKKHSKEALFGGIFNLGVLKRETTPIWGYANECNFVSGVREYQKVENSIIEYMVFLLRQIVLLEE